MQVYRYFKDEGLNRDKLIPFFSMVDSRRQMHQLVTQKPPIKPASFLDSHIPYISEIERMGIDRKPASIRPGSKAGLAYSEIWNELKIKEPLNKLCVF